MKRYIFAFLSMFVLGACAQPDIVGTWIQPIPGMESESQGITINPDGTAQSVNMHTLQYQGWTRNGDFITLYGLSIGNGMIGHFSEDYQIKILTKNKLLLWNENVPQKYTRKK